MRRGGGRSRCSLVVTFSDTFLIPNKTIAATISSIVQNFARLLGRHRTKLRTVSTALANNVGTDASPPCWHS